MTPASVGAPSASIPAHVVTVSDRAARGDREDASGPVLVDLLEGLGHAVTLEVVPDGIGSVRAAIERALDRGARVVLTTGGTGIGPRDLTPEATAPLLDRLVPGIPERLREVDADAVPASSLSRGLAGVARGALVVNLPGSPAACRSAARVLSPVIPHALAQLAGGDH